MSDEIINGLMPTREELLEQGIVNELLEEEYEIEARAEKEAEGLVESNIVGD